MKSTMQKFPIKEQLKNYFFKCFFILFLYLGIQNSVVLWITSYTVQRPSVVLLTLALWIPAVVVQNAIFNMFLKRVRGQNFHVLHELFSYPHMGAQFIVALLLTFISTALTRFANVFVLVILLYVPLIVIIESILLLLRMVSAFAIYDNHQALVAFNGAFTFLQKKFTKLLGSMIPYILLSILRQGVLLYFLFEAEHVELFYLDNLVVLLIREWIWSFFGTCVMIPMVMRAANLYDQNQSEYFPILQVVHPKPMASVEIEVTEVEEDENT